MKISKISNNIYLFNNDECVNLVLTENGLDKNIEKIFETYHTGITSDSISIGSKTVRMMFDMKSDGFEKDHNNNCTLIKHKFSRYEINIDVSLYEEFMEICNSNKCIGSIYLNYVRCGNYINPILYKRNVNDDFVFLIMSNKNSY